MFLSFQFKTLPPIEIVLLHRSGQRQANSAWLDKNSDLTKKEWNTGSVLETLFVSLVSYVTSTRAGSFPALRTFFQWPKTWSFHQTLRLRPAWPLTPPPKLLAIISNLKGWMVFIRCAKPMTTTHEKTPGRLKALGSCLVFLWQSCQGLAGLQKLSQMSHKFSNQHHQNLICLEPPNGEVVEVLNCLSTCFLGYAKNKKRAP